ncbi:MAG: hypothetical protein AAF195_03580, partial [Pseudomonadota bacterium]
SQKHLITVMGFLVPTNVAEKHEQAVAFYPEMQAVCDHHHVIGHTKYPVTGFLFSLLTNSLSDAFTQHAQGKIDALKDKMEQLRKAGVNPKDIYIEGISLGGVAAVNFLADKPEYKDVSVILYDPVPNVKVILEKIMKKSPTDKGWDFLFNLFGDSAQKTTIKYPFNWLLSSSTKEKIEKIFNGKEAEDPIKSKFLSDKVWKNFIANRTGTEGIKGLTKGTEPTEGTIDYFYPKAGDDYVTSAETNDIAKKIKRIPNSEIRPSGTRPHTQQSQQYYKEFLPEIMEFDRTEGGNPPPLAPRNLTPDLPQTPPRQISSPFSNIGRH